MPKKTWREWGRYWLPVAIACALLVGTAAWVAALLPIREESEAPPQSGTVTTVTTAAFPKILRAWEGGIGLFFPDAAEPTAVYDVPLQSLPEEEQARLRAGVRVDSEERLAALLENYTG